jgi:MFS superfamily sulfate permease-like transporter
MDASGTTQSGLDALTHVGFDWVWLLSVWQTGPAAQRVSRNHVKWRCRDGEIVRASPDNEAVAGALAFRVEASLLCFNVDHVRDAIWQRIRSTPGPLKLVVCDLSTSPLVDLAGVRMLATLHAQLRAAGIRLRLVGAHAKVRDILRAEGMEALVGDFGRRVSVADVIDDFQAKPGAGGQPD